MRNGLAILTGVTCAVLFGFIWWRVHWLAFCAYTAALAFTSGWCAATLFNHPRAALLPRGFGYALLSIILSTAVVAALDLLT